MPTTLLHLKDGRIDRPLDSNGPERALKEIKKGAQKSAEAVKRAEDTLVNKVHLTARWNLRPPARPSPKRPAKATHADGRTRQFAGGKGLASAQRHHWRI